MPLPKKYVPGMEEPRLQELWEKHRVYNFESESDQPVYSIDTPPPTVSGNLHLGHTYSYTHEDIFARFHRMRGENVFYPMGFDDNGLPTERLVEKQLGVKASELDRQQFVKKCQQVSAQMEKEYQALWQRLGLSIDWRYTYRTIDRCAQLTSQQSFIELFQAGLVYRQEAPVIWCPECGTAIAQADVDDLARESELVTLAFKLSNAEILPIATTRPELLPACVAVFVHPGDERYSGIIGSEVQVPLFDQSVFVRTDPAANPEVGTGAVMCCTFGDTVDKQWWYAYQLDHIAAIDHQGKLTGAAGKFAGLPVEAGRQAIKQGLEEKGLVLDRQPTSQVIPVHERCDTPVEYLMSQQWFIRLLDFKQELLAAGEKINWHPQHMQNRYRSWVENLAWDWCISRQRYYGIPFPLWYCQSCGEVILAELDQLPVDPNTQGPNHSCRCGSEDFSPETDVLETWATSSLTPQIVGRWLCPDPDSGESLFEQVYPFSLRPQAHEIIRTWTFYTITKSLYHNQTVPWEDIAISGWGIAGEGMGKISKSRGGGPLPPLEMLERHSADAVRYWAASTGLGKDAVISEEKIKLGGKLTTKLWNVARFSERFLTGNQFLQDFNGSAADLKFSPADRWILSRLQRLVQRSTLLLENYDYAAAKSEIEYFFWTDYADNYLEMCKQRLYTGSREDSSAARYTLYTLLLTLIKLFAPFLPFITEVIYQGLFTGPDASEPGKFRSVHHANWPKSDPNLLDEHAEAIGERLIEIATAIRRYKSENNLSLGTELPLVQIATRDPQLAADLSAAQADLTSVSRARQIETSTQMDNDLIVILDSADYQVGIGR